MDLILTNNVTKRVHKYENVAVAEKSIYYTVIFNVQDMDEGEYNYELVDDDNKVVARGILHYGNYNQENKTTYSNEKNYKQYRK